MQKYTDLFSVADQEDPQMGDAEAERNQAVLNLQVCVRVCARVCVCVCVRMCMSAWV